MTGIRFFSLERSGDFTGTVYWSFRSDAAGTPGVVEIAGGITAPTSRTPTGITRPSHFNAPQTVVALDVPPVALAPGHYWLVLHNGPLTVTDVDNAAGFFMWDSTPTALGHAAQADPAPFEGTWQIAGGERAFSLVGVPEPAVGLVLPAVALLLRRRRR